SKASKDNNSTNYKTDNKKQNSTQEENRRGKEIFSETKKRLMNWIINEPKENYFTHHIQQLNQIIFDDKSTN
ncbi:3531_t:CDS:1, partial [Racocetra persica]